MSISIPLTSVKNLSNVQGLSAIQKVTLLSLFDFIGLRCDTLFCSDIKKVSKRNLSSQGGLT